MSNAKCHRIELTREELEYLINILPEWLDSFEESIKQIEADHFESAEEYLEAIADIHNQFNWITSVVVKLETAYIGGQSADGTLPAL